jgi:molecular chaperone DnaK (HSP70)
MFKVEPSAYQRLSAPKKAYVPSPVKFESTSEARDKYTAYATEIRTPPIGLWVANDLVEVMVQPGADRPISVSKMFSTTSNGQDEMELKIVEGWSRKASECTLLTVFEIEGIPQSPAGRPQIRVTLSIDAEGSMTVTAVDRDNDVVLAEETVEVTPAYSVSPPKGVHAAGSPSPDKHGERRAGYR